MHKVIFLDRDGVINVDIGYAHRTKDIEFVDGILDFICKLTRDGWRIIIVTNQAGIAYGYYDEAAFHKLMRWIIDGIEKAGGSIDSYYYCPHHKDAKIAEYKKECLNRKPSPGMLVQASRELDFELSAAYFVGDSEVDKAAAEAAGIKKFFFLETRFAKKHLDDIFIEITLDSYE